MRFHELGLERTSISYFTGPPGLVDNTAKSITWEDKKNSETTNHLTLFQSLLIVRQAGSKKHVHLKLTTSTGTQQQETSGEGSNSPQQRESKKRISQQLKTSRSQQNIVQSTPALQTPSYNGHPDNTDSS